MPDEIRISHTDLHTLSECGEKYRLRKIEGMKMGARFTMQVGSAVHHAAAEAHTRVLAARTGGASFEAAIEDALPPEAELVALADQTFTEGAVDATPTNEERSMGVPAVREQHRARARAGAATYRTHVARRVDPIAVERKIVVRPKGMNVALSGVIDLVAADPLSGKIVHDTKVSKKRPPTGMADTSLQLTMYYALEAAATGEPPARVGLNYIVQPGSAPGSFVPLQTTRNRDDVRALIERVGAAERSIRAGVFVPANTDHWVCSERYCEFWSVCKFAHRR